MEDIKRFKIDMTRKDFYFKIVKKQYLIKSSPCLLLFAFFIFIAHDSDKIYAYVIASIAILLFCLLILKLLNNRIETLTDYLSAEYLLSNDSITMLYNLVQDRTINFNDQITIKSFPIGTFILNGDYDFTDFYLSKYQPQKIPINDEDIFIPLITENYELLIESIKKYKKAHKKH